MKKINVCSLNLFKVNFWGFLFLLLFSCSKQEIKPKTLDLSSIVLNTKDLNNIVFIINEKVKEQNLLMFNSKNQIKISSDLRDKEMALIMDPLIQNGEIIHDKMVNFISETNEFEQMSKEEKYEILNFDDAELAALSFLMSYEYQTVSVDGGRIRACLSAALGIAGMKSLFTNTMALGTVETAMGALRIIGKRYLGYIGVALMIYDFADCVN